MAALMLASSENINHSPSGPEGPLITRCPFSMIPLLFGFFKHRQLVLITRQQSAKQLTQLGFEKARHTNKHPTTHTASAQDTEHTEHRVATGWSEN